MAGSATWIAHVDAFVDPDGPENKQAASRDLISKMLLNRTITLQQLVLVAGKYLTSSDNTIRARGLLLLAELLHDLADTPMEDAAIHSLATFFSDRLQDWHSLRPALIGSIALLKRQKRVGAVHSKDAEQLCKSVVDEVNVQALSQKDRMLSLELYECLLFLHGSSVRQLGPELVLGIIAAVDGEKDARNTLVAFRLVEQLAALFPDPDGPLKENAKDVFDVLSCYFPITYNPPQDSRGITREDLSAALLKVFAATSFFAPFCFPEFLEKLSSTLQTAKLDALKYMGECALSYGPEVMAQFSRNIWLGLKSEIFRLEDGALDHKDMQIREEAYFCFTRCVQASQKGKRIEDQLKTMGHLLKLVLEDEDVLDFLRRLKSEMDQRTDFGSGVTSLNLGTSAQLRAIGRLLGAAVGASSTACYIVAKEFFSSLVPTVESTLKSSDYELCDSISAKENCVFQEAGVSVTGLEATRHVLEGAKDLAHSLVDSSKPGPDDSTSTKWLEPIVLAAPFLNHAFSQVVAGRVRKKELTNPAVAGLQALVTFPAALSPLSEDQLEIVLTFLTVTFLDKTKDSDVRDLAFGAILAVSSLEGKSCNSSRHEPSSTKGEVNVLNNVVPKLLEAVQEAQSAEPMKSHLHALAALSKSRAAVRLSVLKAFGNVISNKLGGTLISAEQSFEFAKMVLILQSLCGEIIPFSEMGSVDQMAACDVVMDIWRTVGSLSDSVVHVATEIFVPLMGVVRVTVQRCPEGLQKEILAMGLSVLRREISFGEIMRRNVPQAPNTEFMVEREWFVALMGSVIVGLLPSVVFEEKEKLLRLFVCTSVADQDPVITDVAAQAAASLLNKWQENKGGTDQVSSCTLNEAIVIAVDAGWMPMVKEVLVAGAGSVLRGCCREDAEKLAARSIYALALAGKGLAMRGHSRTSDIAGLILRILQYQGTPTTNSGRPVTLDLEDRSKVVFQSPVGKAAVQSFGVFVKEHSTFLSKSQNAVSRPLYKQRFFTSMLSPLIEAVHLAGKEASRIWFHRAFASLFSGTPLAAALTEGKRVFPLVLEGLSTLCVYPEDSDYLLQILLALSSFLVDENHGRNIAAEYVQSMVTRLIPLVQYELSMVIRESALQCLAAIVGLPFTLVFPVKSQVMKAITAALDDKKRLVRKEAVRCLQVWSAISSK